MRSIEWKLLAAMLRFSPLSLFFGQSEENDNIVPRVEVEEEEVCGGGFCDGHDNNDEQKSITLLPITRAGQFFTRPRRRCSATVSPLRVLVTSSGGG